MTNAPFVTAHYITKPKQKLRAVNTLWGISGNQSTYQIKNNIMSKYFIDTEFLEGSQKEKFPISLFRKSTPNTIDLISIGIVADGGREYYEISKDFNLKEAWNRYDEKVEIMYGDMRNRFPEGRKYKEYWIRENVLKPIWRELFFQANDYLGLSNEQVEYVSSGAYDCYFSFKSLKCLIEKYGKTNKQIAEEVKEFVYEKEDILYNHEDCKINHIEEVKSKINFYGYFADYDWVVFCWLFGKMIDLPKGFPMYCKDLQQILDEKEVDLKSEKGVAVKGSYVESVGAFEAFQFKSIKDIPSYPKQDPSKSHNALEDARWNKQLFDFLNTI